RVEVPPVLLGVLAVVALGTGEPEDALLEDGVAPVPEREGEAERLPVVADAAQPVLVPPVDPGAGVIVGEEVPRGAVVAVVLPDRAPGPLGQVGAPRPPRRLPRVGGREPGPFDAPDLFTHAAHSARPTVAGAKP